MRWTLCCGALLFSTVFAHQQPEFPGQNAHKPPEVHHQNVQQHNQPPPAHPDTPPAQAQEFGGQQAHNAEHIKEHLDGKVDPTANMTPEQLQFHYFNMHDLDKNGKLDGIELIKAITHFHQENPSPGHQPGAPPPLPSEVELEQMTDSILNEDDFNKDGYIDYGEFLKAQKQREEQGREQQQQQQQQPQQQQAPPPR